MVALDPQDYTTRVPESEKQLAHAVLPFEVEIGAPVTHGIAALPIADIQSWYPAHLTPAFSRINRAKELAACCHHATVLTQSLIHV